MSREDRKEKLTEGKCDFCQEDAQIPYKGAKFCYSCWHWFWRKLTYETGVYCEPTNTETREEEIKNSIKQKEKNGIRRPGPFYVNFNL